MFIIARKIKGKIEFLKDSNSTSNRVFHNYSNAETFVRKLNSRTHSNKQWYVMKYKNNQKLFNSPTER